MDKVELIIVLLQTAEPLGEKLVDLIKSWAVAELTDTELVALEQRWTEDAARARRNAGLPPT